ncbi:MAG TPA: CFI-box-CTERM domain-containing protein [Geomonas sp.]|nr:CFI-box-CTERM domain-containing protein [Geomonas sp.]
MKVRWLTRLLVAASLLSVLLPHVALADLVTIYVDPNHAQDSTHFKTIQSAIDQANTNLSNPTNADTYQIQVADGTYSGSVTLKNDSVPIFGTTTAGTFLTTSGTGALISTNGHSNVTIRNFTFKAPTAIAISASGGSGITITNNVFWLPSATAVQVLGASSSSVVNNTFYQNGTAINTTSADLKVDNNIFVSNTIVIQTSVTLSNISYNDYFNNTNNPANLGSNPLPNSVTTNADPQFVNTLAGDFHLQSTSPCKGTGDPNLTGVKDRGAYGGPDSDPAIPATVTGLKATLTSPANPVSILLNWNASSDSTITGYRVYYGVLPAPATPVIAQEGASGFAVSGIGTTTATLTFDSLPAPAAPTGTPVLTTTSMDRALQLTWTPVLGATDYLIYYNTSDRFDPTTLSNNLAIKVDSSVTSYLFSGLTNGTRYTFAVLPRAQTRVSASVTATINGGSQPGNTNESAYSPSVTTDIGSPVDGTLSAQASDYPESVSPYPNVKGTGCFIATAAFGFYSAPEVQALRMFRDRYLLTNAPGRAFVAWYYQHGPSGARYLNAHPWLKAPVRVALFPLVLFSAFLVCTSAVMKLALLMTAGASAYFLYRRIEIRSMARARRVS